jgi:hypothetical protein
MPKTSYFNVSFPFEYETYTAITARIEKAVGMRCSGSGVVVQGLVWDTEI